MYSKSNHSEFMSHV